MQRILTGEQYMTIYLDIRQEAEKAAELAVALGKGEKPAAPTKVANGTADIPAFLLDPIAVTADRSRTPSSRTASTRPRRSAPDRSSRRAQGGNPVVLAASNISKRYGAVQALDGVSLDLPPGEVVALVGDNGAGKSTLVKVLSGVVTADDGTIEQDGHRSGSQVRTTPSTRRVDRPPGPRALREPRRRQQPLPGRRAAPLDGPQPHPDGTPARDLLSSLDVRIRDIRVPVAMLSGGQRQSVAIARALIGEPRVVILDEPTAALGVEQTAQVLGLIRRLRDRGLAVLVISHNLADVRAVSDRIVVLRLGRNAGEFSTAEATPEAVVAAITGGTA